jgi:hypothetical protein
LLIFQVTEGGGLKQSPVPLVDRDDGFAKGIDFIVAPKARETLDGLAQVGPDPIGLGLGIQSESAIALESILEVAVRKELVESLTSRRLTGSHSHADAKAKDRTSHHSNQGET